MSIRKLLFPFLVFPVLLNAQSFSTPWEDELIAFSDNGTEHVILGPSELQSAKWHQLAQPLFWQQIMRLSPDSVLINVASNRQIISKMGSKRWNGFTGVQKQAFRDSVRIANDLVETERILVTTGKNDFYRFDLVYPNLSRGVAAFESNGVDPWYAQSILLIESPVGLARSSAGAYGPFQLMPSVARSAGLKVTKAVDERKDFEKSAYAASLLLKRSCIPSARSIALSAGLVVDEQAIWFRLLVMHVYHAGATNVRAVVQKIGTPASGEELIQKMWTTTAGAFGNSSQNYSQLALAAHIELADFLSKKACEIYRCVSAYEGTGSN